MKTLKLRIRDKHADQLNRLSGSVNFVWNYVNDLSYRHLQKTGKFFSAYDLNDYTKGSGELLGLHSQTIQAITEELVTRRKQFKKAKLKWRVSNKKSARRSLGWIPFKKVAIKYADGYVQYGKHQFKLWDSYGLSKYNVKTGSFVEDSRGRWYVCLVVEAPKIEKTTSTKAIGIDLGLKNIATCSDGVVISVRLPVFSTRYMVVFEPVVAAKYLPSEEYLHVVTISFRFLYAISPNKAPARLAFFKFVDDNQTDFSFTWLKSAFSRLVWSSIAPVKSA
jgi:transposase